MLKNKYPIYTTIYIWGIKFSILKKRDIISEIDDSLNSNKIPIQIIGINPETVVHAHQNDTLRNGILKSDYVIIDNTLVYLLLKLNGYRIKQKIPTPDLFDSLLLLASNKRYKVVILGSTESVLNIALNKIKCEYPNIDINGFDGYFSRDKIDNVIDLINNCNPDMLFIALPSPEKELFIINNKGKLNAKLLLGVGGAVDCKAGIVKRPPLIIRSLGLEGILRAIQNPRNYGMRYIKYYPQFFQIVLKHFMNKNQRNL